MRVVVDIRWQVKVDDVGDVRNIQTSRRDVRGDEDGRLTRSEGFQRRLALLLRAIAVDARRGLTVLVQEILELVRTSLRFDENQSQTRHGFDQIEKHIALFVVRSHALDGLRDQRVRRADATDREKDVIVQEVRSHSLDFPRERCGEQHRLTLATSRHVALVDDLSNLRLETHVQHAIRLVEREILNSAQRDLSAIDEIDQTTRRGDENVAPAFHGAELFHRRSATVDDARGDAGLVRELPRFFVNLARQFARRRKHERERIRLAVHMTALKTALQDTGDDGKAKRRRFTGTRLRARH